MNIGYVLCHGHYINPIIHLSLACVIRAIVNIFEWFVWKNKLWNPQEHEAMEGTSFIFLFFKNIFKNQNNQNTFEIQFFLAQFARLWAQLFSDLLTHLKMDLIITRLLHHISNLYI